MNLNICCLPPRRSLRPFLDYPFDPGFLQCFLKVCGLELLGGKDGLSIAGELPSFEAEYSRLQPLTMSAGMPRSRPISREDLPLLCNSITINWKALSKILLDFSL